MHIIRNGIFKNLKECASRIFASVTTSQPATPCVYDSDGREPLRREKAALRQKSADFGWTVTEAGWEADLSTRLSAIEVVIILSESSESEWSPAPELEARACESQYPASAAAGLLRVTVTVLATQSRPDWDSFGNLSRRGLSGVAFLSFQVHHDVVKLLLSGPGVCSRCCRVPP